MWSSVSDAAVCVLRTGDGMRGRERAEKEQRLRHRHPPLCTATIEKKGKDVHMG